MTRKSTFPVQSGAKWGKFAIFEAKNGGEMGIRTPDTVARIHAFQACSFNHSDTSPAPCILPQKLGHRKIQKPFPFILKTSYNYS